MAYTTIKKPSDYFNTKLYTGNGASQSITGVGFQPDWTWVKSRSGAYNHEVIDVIRGGGVGIFPNLTNAESSGRSLSAFTSDGFTLNGSDTTSNNNGSTYASWNWLANGAGVANTDGSISSTVSANTTSGFSIVKWTSTDTAGSTIGHGLGSIPKMIITKKITSGNPGNWTVYHNSLGNTKSIALNTTNVDDTATSYWNNTSPTSSVFSTGTYFDVGDYIAYCFADVQGYSKFGSYTGNASTDGPFIYTGFKPAFVIIRRTDDPSGRDWFILDNKRDTENPLTQNLETNNGDAEYASERCDFLSNGFKLTTSSGGTNASGANHIYMAFAEEPLVGDNPATAR